MSAKVTLVVTSLLDYSSGTLAVNKGSVLSSLPTSEMLLHQLLSLISAVHFITIIDIESINNISKHSDLIDSSGGQPVIKLVLGIFLYKLRQ